MRQIKVIPVLLLLALSACVSWEVTAYRTIGTITASTEAARKSWVDYVGKKRVELAGKPADLQALEADVARGGVVYGQYQTAMRAAHDAIVAYKTGAATQDAVTIALNAVSAASGNLISLLQQLQSK